MAGNGADIVRQVGLKVSEAKIGVSTNSRHLLERNRFYWLDTNFLSVDFIPFEEVNDSRLQILDEPGYASLEIGSSITASQGRRNILMLKGEFSRLEKEAEDKRYSIFGNLGIFSPWALVTLETVHDIYTFHACGLVKGRELMIILGGAGAGKTIFILSALQKGWKVFSTEFLHFRAHDRVECFKGSLSDAVRVDTFKTHFPPHGRRTSRQAGRGNGGKLVANFSSFQCEHYALQDPEITLVFPHVEEKRQKVVCKEVTDSEHLLRLLFDNVSEKISKSILLYGKMALPGLDTLALAAKRMQSIRDFLERARIKRRFVWVSGVQDVMQIF